MENNNAIELMVRVKPGEVTTTFQEFKAMVKKELEEKYSNIEVSEERLKDAKDARARLNKAKASLKETMKSAQIENDEPLRVPKEQAKELEELLNSAINTLDAQIKEIEERQRSQKMDEARGIFMQVIAAAPAEVQEFAVTCDWIVKPEWGNKTYAASKVRKDCEAVAEEISHALDLFQGEFRPQMLEDYRKNGSLAKAQLFGAQLQRQKDAYEEAQRIRREAAAARQQPQPEPEPVKAEEPEVKAEDYVYTGEIHNVQVGRQNPTEEIPSPSNYIKDERSYQKGYLQIRIALMRYQAEWLEDILKSHGIEYRRFN